MIVLKGAQILTMTEDCAHQGDIAIKDGKLGQVGGAIAACPEDEVIDCTGMYAMPGIVDAHCHIGMWEDSLDFEGADGNESTDPVTPHMRAIDAINPYDRCFAEAVEAGVTTVMTGPGSANAVGGSFVLIKTVGRTVDEMVIREPAAMKIAFGENPKRVYGEQKRMPLTRMATAALIREALTKAKRYQQDVELAGEDASKRPAYDAKNEAFLPVLRGEIPLKAHCHRADDIVTALRIAREFELDITLEHVTDGYRIADVLKEAGAKLIIGPLLCDRSKPELSSLSMENPRKLHEAGLDFAIMTDHPVIPEPYLRTVAALAVREGLDEWTALRSITLTAARILDVDDRLGSLETGKDADVVLFDKHPFAMDSRVQRVYLDGREVYRR